MTDPVNTTDDKPADAPAADSQPQPGSMWPGAVFALVVLGALVWLIAQVMSGFSADREKEEARNTVNETAAVSFVFPDGAKVQSADCRYNTCTVIADDQRVRTLVVQDGPNGTPVFGIADTDYWN